MLCVYSSIQVLTFVLLNTYASRTAKLLIPRNTSPVGEVKYASGLYPRLLWCCVTGLVWLTSPDFLFFPLSCVVCPRYGLLKYSLLFLCGPASSSLYPPRVCVAFSVFTSGLFTLRSIPLYACVAAPPSVLSLVACYVRGSPCPIVCVGGPA